MKALRSVPLLTLLALTSCGIPATGVVEAGGPASGTLPMTRVYFVENGANQRSSKVVYDREGSSIALATTGDIAFEKCFEGAGWFHITGITPAISQGAADLALRHRAKALAPEQPKEK